MTLPSVKSWGFYNPMLVINKKLEPHHRRKMSDDKAKEAHRRAQRLHCFQQGQRAIFLRRRHSQLLSHDFGQGVLKTQEI